MGPERGARSGRVDQPELWGEGQLLLGGVLGDGRGGVDGMSTAVEPCRKSPYRTFRATRGTSRSGTMGNASQAWEGRRGAGNGPVASHNAYSVNRRGSLVGSSSGSSVTFDSSAGASLANRSPASALPHS